MIFQSHDHNHKKATVLALAFIFIFTNVNIAIAKDPLIYEGSAQDPSMNPNSANAQPQYPMAPVAYNTNYATAYSPYASFMASPYSQGNLQQAYQGPSVGPMGSPVSPPPPTANQDPFYASEVSPYSRYSPYMEIVGEGSDYTLGIDDVVTIIVRDQPDFSGRYVIDPEGNIQYNFVGDIKADGKTKEELKADITERLREYVRYPEVAVMISQYRSKAIYVFGYVGRPGKYAMKGDRITVKEAVVAAGLPRADAAIKRVYVIRPSEKTEDGEARAKKVNLDKLINKGDSAEDFILKPGDTIVVHQRYFDKFVNAFNRLVSPLFQSVATYELLWGDTGNGILNSD